MTVVHSRRRISAMKGVKAGVELGFMWRPIIMAERTRAPVELQSFSGWIWRRVLDKMSNISTCSVDNSVRCFLVSSSTQT
jgi:hypothetical protein